MRAAAEEPDAPPPSSEQAGHSQLMIFLVGVADVAFVGAVAVHVAFVDVSTWPVVVAAMSAVAFAVAAIVALVSRRRTTITVASVVIGLAALAVAIVAINSARRYDALRHETFGDRGGVRLVEPDSAAGRRMGAAMLSSISASLAAIAALPLPPYLLVRACRAGRAARKA